jgi:hypothetical protein
LGVIVHMAADSSIELPTAAGASIEGDELICRDETGGLVARAESRSVLAFGVSPVLRRRLMDEDDSEDIDLFKRYDQARARYLALEAEQNEAIAQVRAGGQLRALIRLQRIAAQLDAAHDSELVPARLALLEDLTTEDSPA